MKYPLLLPLKNQLYFTVEDIAVILDIQVDSARVLCNRYTKNGMFIRLKKNFYVLTQNWDLLENSKDAFFRIANYLQVPSYISFMTALAYYEITTQVQRNFIESAGIKRSIQYEVKGVLFKYYLLNKKYYFDFNKKEDRFIATKEKALVDAVYLYSLGKYAIDFNALDLKKLDQEKLRQLIRVYSERTKAIVTKLCKL
jgi:predicted transcriptional regulator of viral defense system